MAVVQDLRLAAEADLRRAQYRQAIPKLRRLVAEDQADEESISDLAYALALSGAAEEARLALQQARALAPDSPRTLEATALLAARAGDALGAERAGTELVRQWPDLPEGYISLCSARFTLGDIIGAEQALRNGLTVTPRSGRLHQALVNLYQSTHRREELRAAVVAAREAGVDLGLPRRYLNKIKSERRAVAELLAGETCLTALAMIPSRPAGIVLGLLLVWFMLAQGARFRGGQVARATVWSGAALLLIALSLKLMLIG